jgi:hypothetical protein
MGIYYFKRSNDEEEKKFFSTLRNYKSWGRKKESDEDFRVAKYINEIADINNKVLVDDAAAFKIVAQLKSLEGIELPANKSFGTVVENPLVGVKYMCVAKLENKYKNFTVLNYYNLTLMQEKGQFITELVYQTESWAIYKLYPADE